MHQILQQSPLAGFQFHEGKAVWSQLRVGDPLTLIRETDNPYDPWAVRIDWNHHVLGYVPRRDNHAVSRLLDAGRPLEARIIDLQESRNPRARIRFEVSLP